MEEKLPYSVTCIECGERHLVYVDPTDLVLWMDKKGLIQDLMPYLSDEERELLISKTCNKCFNKLFPPEEE